MTGGILLLNAECIQNISLLFTRMSLLESNSSQKHICTELKMHVALELKFTKVSSWMKSVSINSPNVYSVTIERWRESQTSSVWLFHSNSFTFLFWTWATELIKNIKAISWHKITSNSKKNPQSCCQVTVSWFIDSANLQQWDGLKSFPITRRRGSKGFHEIVKSSSWQFSFNEVKTA